MIIVHQIHSYLIPHYAEQMLVIVTLLKHVQVQVQLAQQMLTNQTEHHAVLQVIQNAIIQIHVWQELAKIIMNL